MYLVAIGWLYVAVMMALAEATSSQGSVLGALFTFLLYGLLPIAIVLYIMGAPRRREARQRAEQAQAPAASAQGDGGDHAAAELPRVAIAAERKEP